MTEPALRLANRLFDRGLRLQGDRSLITHQAAFDTNPLEGKQWFISISTLAERRWWEPQRTACTVMAFGFAEVTTVDQVLDRIQVPAIARAS